MDCRECKAKIHGYLAGHLTEPERTVLLAHLDICPECRLQLEQYRSLDELISASDIAVPAVNLTKEILAQVSKEILLTKPRPEKHRRRIFSLAQDLVAAAAAALIIFWCYSPIIANNHEVRMPTEEVVKVSSSVGSVFEAYLDFSVTAIDKLSGSFQQFGSGLMKGDEKY